MNCPKCHSGHRIKRDFVGSRQRYYCKDCHYTYSLSYLRLNGKSEEFKAQALELYLEGFGFRSIGRILKISHVSVYRWIKSYGMKANSLSHRDKIDIEVA